MTIAVAAVPPGLTAMARVALGNCKLGFFGDYGPIAGGRAIRTLGLLRPADWPRHGDCPWLIIWRRARSPTSLTAGWVLAPICIFIVVAFIYMPQLGNAEIHWSGTCN
ncbi:MAG: hypothetical protein R2735_08475 [Microthrixaceae bacterium]